MPRSGTGGALFTEGTLGHMPAYGTTHLGMLAILVVLAVALVAWARRADPVVADRALRIAGWILLANAAFWTLWGFMPWAWNLDESLPLHFSDALRFVIPIALITRARWAILLAYYWGLTLNLQSVLTPDVNYFVWIPLEFVEYWAAHLTGVLAPIVLLWGLGYRPTWRGMGAAYGLTVLWAGIAVTGNALTGANYGYLNHAPGGPSLLDVMGPWPQYLLVEAIAIAVVWALMTWPWAALDRRLGTPEVGSGALLRRRSPVPFTGRGGAGADDSGGPATLACGQARSSTSARRSGP